jgi:carboxyl-terminal processing protease
MKLAKALPVSLLALALTAPVAWLTAQADTGATTPEQATASKLLYGLLSDSRYSYRPRALDDALSAEVFRRYLESLDGAKLYFTAADIARLESYRTRLDDAIKSGEVAPAFEVFSLYQTRVAERIAYARGLLTQDIFRFDGDDRWEYDREKAPWAADTAELDRLWRQSVRNDWLRLKLAGKQPDEIRKTLDKRYAASAKAAAEYNGADAFQIFINAYANSIDPHTDYLDPRAADRFNQSMSLKINGIGAQLQKQDDVVVIRELIPGGPAMRSGKLNPGDRIVAVGQGDKGPMEDVVGWRIDDVVEKIKGPRGTSVRLDIVPAEAVLDSKPNRIVLKREEVRLEDQKAKAEVLTIPGVDGQPARRIGVIKLPAFYFDFDAARMGKSDFASSSRDVERILRDFRAQQVEGVVVDLRNNGGGALNEAVAIAGLFIDEGPVVQTRDVSGRVSVESDEQRGVAWDGPLAVLINRGSASASEILAGAIQDYGRGLIIGETSFGKGTVQNLHEFDRWPGGLGMRLGEAKYTVAQFFRPGGSSTQNRGVVPDIKFPVTVDAAEFGESTYDNALPWTRIAAVPYVRYGEFSPLLARLETLHEARVNVDKEFQWLREDITQYRTETARKWVSLNEAERRAERDRDAAKRRQRQEERKALGLDLDPLAEDTDDGLTSGERDILSEAAREKAAEKRPDPLLRETAAILSDAMRVLDGDRQLSAQVLPKGRSALHWAD